MKNEIVITGMGVVSPIGGSVEEFWEANLTGKSGLSYEKRMDLSGLPCGWVAGIIPDEIREPVRKRFGEKDRSWSDTLMHAALEEALVDASFEGGLERPAALIFARVWPGPTGSYPEDYARHTKEVARRYKELGDDPAAYVADLRSQNGHASTLEVIDQSYFPREVSKRLGTNLFATRVEATCSGGLRAVIEASRLLQSGKADFAVVTACVSRNTQYVLSQYAQLMAMSRWSGNPEQASMPFDKRRCGMVLSESAGALVLETAEHAKRRGVLRSHAVISGWGLALDTTHVTAPRVDAIERVMRSAIDNAGMTPDDIDVVNAHGTSTRLNDLTEARALHKVFGERMKTLDVCAIKSLTGHGSAASGVIESTAAARTLCRGIVPPVPTCTEPDPECNVKTSLTPVERPVKTVLKDSFGFGGQYASVVFSRPSDPR